MLNDLLGTCNAVAFDPFNIAVNFSSMETFVKTTQQPPICDALWCGVLLSKSKINCPSVPETTYRHSCIHHVSSAMFFVKSFDHQKAYKRRTDNEVHEMTILCCHEDLTFFFCVCFCRQLSAVELQAVTTAQDLLIIHSTELILLVSAY